MALSFVDLDHQHVELLPARTVMSMFTLGGVNGHGGDGGDGKAGPVSCLISIGDAAVGLGAILGSGSAQGFGTSCDSTGTGGAGGAGVSG
jgi:hypothetical protein